MTQRNVSCRTSMVWAAIGALLLYPTGARAARRVAAPLATQGFLQDPQDSQDTEQERRDREQEARDREQEKRDREQERMDRMQERYDQGRDELDEERYDKAEARFDQLAQSNGPQTD